MTRIRLLGPVELAGANAGLPAGPPQRCGVLAALAIDAGQQVPVEVLVDRVWGEQAPRAARRALHAHITRIRRLLEAAGGPDDPVRLVRRGGGYQLDVDPEQVDIHRLRGLVARAGEPGCAGRQRAALLSEALDLWRGEPLAGVPGAWAERVRDTWRRQRVDLLVAWAQAELDSGDPGAVVGPLSDLVAEYPLLEPPAAMLMRALQAAGRTAEALDSYAATRRRLVGELGIEPGPELQEVQNTILRGDRDRAAARIIPAQLPLDVPGFAGRDGELAELDALLARTGRPPAVLISAVFGTAGVGKTALAVRWAHRVADRFPDGQLYVNLRGFDPTGSTMSAAEALRGFLDALEVPPQRVPTSLTAQIGLYRSLLAGRRMLVVLDNARDADQVRPLLPGAPGCLVLVTSRSRLAGLVAAEGAHPVTLGLLSPGDARQLLASRLGRERVAAQPDAVDEIIDRCARLPLALAIVAARAAADPQLPPAALAAELRAGRDRLAAFAGDDPSTDVRAVFSWSYGALGPPAARLFRLLGLHPGPDLAVPAAASLAGVPADRTRALLAEVSGAHLLAEPSAGRYAFHDLLRAYASELANTLDTAGQRDAARHRMLEHYLHAAHAANRMLLEPHLDPIPLAAPPPGIDVVRFADRRQAMAWFSAEYPVLLAAIELAAGAGLDRYVWPLAWSMITFLNRGGRWQVQASVQRSALDAARRLGDRAGQAQAHRGLGGACTFLGRDRDAEAHLRAALALFRALGDRNGQASAHSGLSKLLGRQGRDVAALGHVRRALALYRAASHRAGVAYALNSLGWYQAKLGQGRQAIGSCRRAIPIHQEVGNAFGEAATWDTLGYAHFRLGEYERAAACYRRALELNRLAGDRYLDTEVLVNLGDAYHAGGDTASARDAWQRAAAILDELDQAGAARVRRKLGQLPAARRPSSSHQISLPLGVD